MRFWIQLTGLWLAVSLASAAERVFDFSTNQPGELPAGMKTFVAGSTKAAEWKVVLDEAPTQFEAISPKALPVNRMPVLAQLRPEVTDEHFPVAYFADQDYGDFTFTTRFKIVSGAREQMAGLVFRLQDEKNFYVARVNSLEGNVRFYKFVNGERTQPVGNNIPVPKGVWHELTVECEANRVVVRLNGKEAIPALSDNSFGTGKVGFLTKSDAVAYFSDAKITYRPIVTLAETLLQATLEDQPRLQNLRIYGKTPQRNELHVMAAKLENELGLAATDVEQKVLANNELYAGRTKSGFVVTAPIRDRNGEAMGVVKFFLKHFPGQTEANAVARVEVALKELQKRAGTARTLTGDQ
jgi:hypothetical protein